MSENLREKAAQEGAEAPAKAERALMLVEVALRDEAGRVAQYRIVREATPEDVTKAWRRQNRRKRVTK